MRFSVILLTGLLTAGGSVVAQTAPADAQAERRTDAIEHAARLNETPEQRQQRLAADRARSMDKKRHAADEARSEANRAKTETPEQHQARLAADEARSEANRAKTETPEQRQARLAADRTRSEANRAKTETPEQHQARLAADRARSEARKQHR